MKNLKLVGLSVLLAVLVSACSLSYGSYPHNPHRNGRGGVIVIDRTNTPRGYRYYRTYRLSNREFSHLYYQLKMTDSNSERRRIVRSIPRHIKLSRYQADQILMLEYTERDALKIYKELVPHFINRRDAEYVARSFYSPKMRERALREARKVPQTHNNRR